MGFVLLLLLLFLLFWGCLRRENVRVFAIVVAVGTAQCGDTLSAKFIRESVESLCLILYIAQLRRRRVRAGGFVVVVVHDIVQGHDTLLTVSQSVSGIVDQITTAATQLIVERGSQYHMAAPPLPPERSPYGGS